jgi:hypothetical protein
VAVANASGLWWRVGDTLITTFPDQSVVTLRIVRGDTMRTPSFATSDSLQGEWALVVAHRDDDGFVSTPAIVGGTITTRCADRDVSGRVIGFMARCGDRLVALPVGEVPGLMGTRDSLGVMLWECLGIEARCGSRSTGAASLARRRRRNCFRSMARPRTSRPTDSPVEVESITK